jgi:cytidylate kinase
MAKTPLLEKMKERSWEAGRKLPTVGPFVAISRQYGCHGYSLGVLLATTLSEQTGQDWGVYHKDILERLATETNLAQEFIEREMSSKHSVLVDFFRAFSTEHIPSGYEIRNRITTIMRGLAIQGQAIIIGQGSAGATQDLPNGLSIRLEAPDDWRVRQVSAEEGLDAIQARQKIHEVEAKRDYIRHIYELKFPRRPAFQITYDCSGFSVSEIARHIIAMMKIKGLIRP